MYAIVTKLQYNTYSMLLDVGIGSHSSIPKASKAPEVRKVQSPAVLLYPDDPGVFPTKKSNNASTLLTAIVLFLSEIIIDRKVADL